MYAAELGSQKCLPDQIQDCLLRDLESALSASPHVPQRQVRLEHRNGRVVIRGRVGSYYQKQMAQEALLRVEGVEELENQLEVHWA